MSHFGAVRRCCRLSFSPLLAAALVPAAALLFAPAALAAEPAPVFGKTGQVVLPELMGIRSGVPGMFTGLGMGGAAISAGGAEVGWGGVLGYAEYTSGQENVYSGALYASKVDTRLFWATPSVDVFVGRGVSIGASVGYLYAQQHVTATTLAQPLEFEGYAVGASPRIGYVVPIARGLSFWPRLSVSAAYSEQTVLGTGDFPQARGRAFSGGVDLALVYQPIQRLMFKVSPHIVAGKSYGEAYGGSQASRVETAFFRVGGEATVGLVF